MHPIRQHPRRLPLRLDTNGRRFVQARALGVHQPQGVKVRVRVAVELGHAFRVGFDGRQDAFLQFEPVPVDEDDVGAASNQIQGVFGQPAAVGEANDGRCRALECMTEDGVAGVGPRRAFHRPPGLAAVPAQPVGGLLVHINVPPTAKGRQAFCDRTASATVKAANHHRTRKRLLR